MNVVKKIALGVVLAGGLLGGSFFAYRVQLLPAMFSIFAYPALKVNAYFIEPFKRRAANKNSAEYDAIKRQLTIAQLQNVRLRAALNHAHDTKTLRAFNKRYQERGSIAQILARNFSDESHYFIIDAGASDGIEKDMVVLYNNNLVGKIIEVHPWYSKVALITDRSCKVAAYCSQTRAKGIAEGDNHKNETSLKYVDHLAKVNNGDIVLSSGQGMVFPAGFSLGRVAATSSDGLYQSISIQPLCDFKEIPYCLVMAKS